MFGCPHMFGCPCMFECSLCLNAPCMFGQPQCLDAPIYLDDVWMPPVHTQHKERILCQTKEVSTCPHTSELPPVHKQHKESMLCQTKGVSICPHRFRCHHMLGYHLYVGMPPLCLDAAICLDAPSVCLNATLCLNTPICLDAPPVCLDIPHMFALPICLGAHLYLWTYPLYGWTSPHVWTLPVCLDVLHMFGLPPVCLDVGIQTYGSVQMY